MITPAASSNISQAITQKGFAVFDQLSFNFSKKLRTSQIALQRSWERLKEDPYLKGSSVFRYRRYGRFKLSPSETQIEITPLPHAPFYQSAENNSYAGGIPRNFAPLERSTRSNKFLRKLIEVDFLALPLSKEDRSHDWEIDVHLYRVIANQNFQGEPTPEGIHHDGFDYFAAHLRKRINVSGGVSTIYDKNKKPLASCTLKKPFDSMLVEDARVMHGVTPISPVNPTKRAIRDIIVINFIRKLRDI